VRHYEQESGRVAEDLNPARRVCFIQQASQNIIPVKKRFFLMAMKRHTPGTIDPLALSESEQALIKKAAEAHPAPINISHEESVEASKLVQQGYLIARANEVIATELALQARLMMG
jgi:hypothetical protein